MMDIYIDYIDFLVSLIKPALPEPLKVAVMPMIEDIKNSIKIKKNFLMLHYVTMKKICEDPRSQQNIKNMVALLDNEEELERAALDLKNGARHLIDVCQGILDAPDEDIIENVEKICLYTKYITAQHIGTTK